MSAPAPLSADEARENSGALLLPMVHQVGGHRAATEDEPPYMLRLRPHFMLKIVQGGPRGERELAFYRRLFPPPDVDADAGDGGDVAEEDPLVFLRGFVPRFHGVRTVRSPPHLGEDAPLVPYMVLEDISDRDRHGHGHAPHQQPRRRKRRLQDDSSHAQQRPSVLDVKMGRATHGPFASPGKAARERGKYPHQTSVGFRIIGMKVYDRATRQYATEGKAYGRGLLPEDVEDALARFFLRRGGGGEEGRGRTGAATAEEVLDFYIGRLEALHDWFQRQRRVRFWSSSLLFVDHEEGDEDESEGDDDEDEEGGEGDRNSDAADGDGETPGAGAHRHHPAADVRMIDFAHVELRGGSDASATAGDENYMYGLASLLAHLRRLRARAAVAAAGAENGRC